MQRRAIRIGALVCLLAVGVGAAVVTWDVERRTRALDSRYQDLSSVVERLTSAITLIAAAQHTYIGSGQPDEIWLDRASVLIEQISNDTTALEARTQSGHSAAHLQAFAAALRTLAQADARAREHLGAGQALRAADVIFRESRDSVAALEAKLRELRYAETAAFAADRAALEQRSWWVLGGAGVLWAIGLVALARVPSSAQGQAERDTAAIPPHIAPPAAAAPPIDLGAAADLCTDISRLTDAASVPGLLARASQILDAPGVIVWMGAGEELFAAATHGYDANTVARLGPIARTADNATSAAWRTGELRDVAGDSGSNGALVAPMFGTDGCIGVVAAEVRNGREGDTATRAVTAMIAAQLSTVLLAWPAASSPAAPAEEPASPPAESERHAAAS